MEHIILVSNLSSVAGYFKLLGLPFKVVTPRLAEEYPSDLPPKKLGEYLIKSKIDTIIPTLPKKSGYWICAVETIVLIDGTVFRKAHTREAAYETLKKLLGNRHNVITSIGLFNCITEKYDYHTNVSNVSFAALSEMEVEWYLNTGEWQGAVGAYKIQGPGACFVKEIKGSYSSITGLPIHEFYKMLIKNGYKYHQEKETNNVVYKDNETRPTSVSGTSTQDFTAHNTRFTLRPH